MPIRGGVSKPSTSPHLALESRVNDRAGGCGRSTGPRPGRSKRALATAGRRLSRSRRRRLPSRPATVCRSRRRSGPRSCPPVPVLEGEKAVHLAVLRKGLFLDSASAGSRRGEEGPIRVRLHAQRPRDVQERLQIFFDSTGRISSGIVGADLAQRSIAAARSACTRKPFLSGPWMDYRDSVHLPKDRLPMRAALSEREPAQSRPGRTRRSTTSSWRRTPARRSSSSTRPALPNGPIHRATSFNKILKGPGLQVPPHGGHLTDFVPVGTAMASHRAPGGQAARRERSGR